ncbi:CgeB family protein [Megasphaera sueciensis]|uniref:CgeB family protein n=1 Tax=Megasphaera sueciensis TaxID=349094 RepID=UPI003CFEA0D1
MKIVIIGQFGIEAFGFHIKENLEAMGHEVVACIPFSNDKNVMMYRVTPIDKVINKIKRKMLFASPRLRRFSLKHIFVALKHIKCDLVICTYDYFLPDEIELIRKITGGKIILWFPDAISNYQRGLAIIAGYDALFYKEPYIVKYLHDIYKLNVFYLPEAFSKLRHTPTCDYHNENVLKDKYRCDIVMIGSLHSARLPLLERLTDFDLKIYGNRGTWWLNTSKVIQYHTNKFLSNHDKADAIKYAKISLNTIDPPEIYGVNVRTFEYAGAGGFQIAQHKKAIGDLFVCDREIVTYRTMDEMIQKVRYYLGHNDERNKIANAGKIRAWKDHDYQKRLTRLINMTFKENIIDEDRFDYRILK